MTQQDPVTRLIGYVLGPPIRFVGRRVERRVRRAAPDVPEPPVWFVPVAVVVAFVGAVVVELVGDRRGGVADPHPAGRRREHAEPEPEATAERDPDPTDGDEDADAVAEALETLDVEHPPVPDESDVKAAYRRLAVETHPDQGGDAERFIEVREAWETVSEGEALSDEAQDMEVTQES